MFFLLSNKYLKRKYLSISVQQFYSRKPMQQCLFSTVKPNEHKPIKNEILINVVFVVLWLEIHTNISKNDQLIENQEVALKTHSVEHVSKVGIFGISFEIDEPLVYPPRKFLTT